jgi:hypothetical protein
LAGAAVEVSLPAEQVVQPIKKFVPCQENPFCLFIRNSMATRKKNKIKSTSKIMTSDDNSSVVCFNKDCKLRKQKSCKGFEACPGFQGK